MIGRLIHENRVSKQLFEKRGRLCFKISGGCPCNLFFYFFFEEKPTIVILIILLIPTSGPGPGRSVDCGRWTTSEEGP